MKKILILVVTILALKSNAQTSKSFHWPTEAELKSMPGYAEFIKSEKSKKPNGDVTVKVPANAVYPKGLFGNWCAQKSFKDKNGNAKLDENEKAEDISGAFCFDLEAKGQGAWSMAASPMKMRIQWYMLKWNDCYLLTIYNPIIKRASRYLVFINENMILNALGTEECTIMTQEQPAPKQPVPKQSGKKPGKKSKKNDPFEDPGF